MSTFEIYQKDFPNKKSIDATLQKIGLQVKWNKKDTHVDNNLKTDDPVQCAGLRRLSICIMIK